MNKIYIISIKKYYFFMQNAENDFGVEKNAEKLAIVRKIR